MAQVGWVYLDDFGGRHRVGVYHGDRSGHLLIHCDLRVIQVDFSVKESRTYSFFVEDELIEISIQKETNGFSYDFQVNKKADTPRNRLRKADERRNRRHMALFLGGFILLVTLFYLGFSWYGRTQRERTAPPTSLVSMDTPENEHRLLVEGKSAVSQLLIVREGNHRRVFYGFTSDSDKQVSGFFAAPDTGYILLPNGFPLTDRDAFSVRYLPVDPRVHRVDFTQPTEQTLSGYFEQAREAEIRAHPETTKAHCECVAKMTLTQKGWQRLADLIFQNVLPEQNPEHNRDSYRRLVRDEEFSRILKQECWDK